MFEENAFVFAFDFNFKSDSSFRGLIYSLVSEIFQTRALAFARLDEDRRYLPTASEEQSVLKRVDQNIFLFMCASS